MGVAGDRDGGAADDALALSPRFWEDRSPHFVTRSALVRALGFVDAVAFWCLWRQMDGLLGSRGILPIAQFLSRLPQMLGAKAYLELPTLLWLSSSDRVLHALCLVGLLLSLLALAGFANAWSLFAIWAIYSSFVHAGQIFYGYGWELLMIEAGFLAIFLVPARGFRVDSREQPPKSVVWLFRWLTFRVMFGAGLIKLRGDPCWTALTCLADHYQTQPSPNPLSPYFNALPLFGHKLGALFNHLVELVAPWGLFGPRRARIVAGTLIVVFQTVLISSGNLAFLNWLTIAVALSAFDDAAFERILPASLRERVRRRFAALGEGISPSRARRVTLRVLVAIIAFLSIFPVVNMLSPEQAMNASYDPLNLVNTYGAFGSVGHQRHEVILEGTWDDPLSGEARWQEYDFPCKPGDPMRPHCVASPYHYRLDWQMWFAGFPEQAQDAWFLKLVYELLRENSAVTALLAHDPFRGRPPRFVRALRYRYWFAPRSSPAYWERELVGEYLRPISKDDAELVAFLKRRGWL
ncbi:MAG TPA: lipase maturation factor family protein [Polyangiaceae bacterium]|nr:lipase maturation factor family protein [Polyangiaceae bacterium]